MSLRSDPLHDFFHDKKKHEFRRKFTDFTQYSPPASDTVGELFPDIEKSRDPFEDGIIRCIIYESDKAMAITADAYFGKPIQGTINDMLKLLPENPSETRDGMENYFSGAYLCTALPIMHISRIKPITLSELRRLVPGFVAPQNYHVLTGNNHHALKRLIDERIPLQMISR